MVKISQGKGKSKYVAGWLCSRLAVSNKGPYKSALIAAPVFYCAQGAAIEEKSAIFLLRRRSKNKISFYCTFSIAAAAVAGRSGCRNRRQSSRFYGAIEALLYTRLNNSCPFEASNLCPSLYHLFLIF